MKCRRLLVECLLSGQIGDDLRQECDDLLTQDRTHAPALFAASQIERAKVLSKSASDEEHVQEIEVLETALSCIAPEEELDQWVDAQNLLSVAFWRRWQTKKDSRDLDRAITHETKCVSVLNEHLNPARWALANYNLGVFYAGRSSGSPQDDIEQTVECMESALRVYMPGYPNYVSAQSRLMAALSRRSKGIEAANLDRGIGCIDMALADPKLTDKQKASLEKSLNILLTRRWGAAASTLASTQHFAVIERFATEPPEIRASRLRAMAGVCEPFHQTRQALRVWSWITFILTVLLSILLWRTPSVLIPSLVAISFAYMLIAASTASEAVEKLTTLPLEYARLVLPFMWWLLLSKDPSKKDLVDSIYSFGSDPQLAIDTLGKMWKKMDKNNNPTAWAIVASAHAWLCLILPRGDRGEGSQNAIAVLQEAGQIFTDHRFGAFQSGVGFSLAKALLSSGEGDRQENLEQAIALLTKHVLPAKLVGPAKRRGLVWGPALQLLGDAYSERASGNRPQNLRMAIQCYLELLGPRPSAKRHTSRHLREVWSLARMRPTRVMRARALAGIAKALLALPEKDAPEGPTLAFACLRNAYCILNEPGIIRALSRMIPAQEGPPPRADSIQHAEAKFDILILLAHTHSLLDTKAGKQDDVAEALLRVCTFEALRKGFNESAYPALLDLGEILFKRERFDEAIGVYDIAIRYIETSRTMARLLERRADILRYNTKPFDRIITALVQSGRSADAFEYAERGKSLSISDLIALRSASGKGVSNPDLDDYAKKQLEARRLNHELALAAHDSNTGALAWVSSTWKRQYTTKQGQAFYKVMEELQRLSDRLTSSDASFRLDVERLGNTAIQHFARQSRSGLVFFRVTPAGTYVFIVTPNGRRFASANPLTRDALDFQLGLNSSSTHPGWWFKSSKNDLRAWRDEMNKTLEKVGDTLMKQVSEILREERNKGGGTAFDRVVLVPNRALSILPLHACWWQESSARRYLLDDFSVIYAPSISVYKRCFERARALGGATRFVGVFNPVPPGNLDFADWEYFQLKALLQDWNCELFQGESATYEALQTASRDTNVVHFSCHGEYRLDDPFESWLGLAHGGNLTLRQILETVRLPDVRLVVLSACKTGLVDPKDAADEHYGLPTAFLFAGAPTVWGTFWPVDDLATALLTVRAYENLKTGQVDMATALRNAQLWLRNARAAEIADILSRSTHDMECYPQLSSNISIFREGFLKGNQERKPYRDPYFWGAFHAVGA
jgi:CHAT domain-containing protein/tetratricopeptide (TPR) repeat protein